MSSEIISVIYKYHQEILDHFNNKESDIIKWQNIAEIVNVHQSDFVKFFKKLKKQDRSNITLDYDIPHQKLLTMIDSEKDIIVKSSLLILSFHHIVYSLIPKEGNYNIKLDGREEMIVLKKDITYYLCISDKIEKNIFFHTFIITFALESLFNKHFYLGIDFEYTNRQIKMCQMNFEHNHSLSSIMMIVSPTDLGDIIMNDFIYLIMCNKYIRKILHGSDSLDIPYIYEQMLKQDVTKIIKFTRAVIDTRFLCEYYKLSRSMASDNKCSIYDAVLYFNVITEEKHNQLDKLVNEDMPHYTDNMWNIYKLSKAQILYAQYDVIYLKYFYYKIVFTATESVETDDEKKNVMDLYRHVLFELTQFVYLQRREIVFLMEKCKELVNPVNNYMVYSKTGVYKLIDVFNKILPGIVTHDPYVEIDKLLTVTYYKTLVLTLIKYIIYTNLVNKYKVHKDKNNIYNEKFDSNIIPDFLEKLNFFYVKRMFEDINKITDNKIRAMNLYV